MANSSSTTTICSEWVSSTAVDRVVQGRLADGSEATLLGAPLVVDWLGEQRSVRADLVPAIRPASARPLIGCRLLRDSRLEIDFPRSTVLVSRA
jgi:hypothetical protein